MRFSEQVSVWYFCMITHMIWLFGIQFSTKFREFSFSMTEFCVKNLVLNETILARCVRQQELLVHAECGVPTGGTLLSRLLCGCPTRGTFPATYSQISLLYLHECK